VPYLVGRLYLRRAEDLRDVVTAIFIGGLAYVPLCLFEIKMSPQLHILVYGFHQHSFEQTVRFGGWRPVVFLQHGLSVATWMISATVAGLGLWRGGRAVPVIGLAPWITVPALAVTSVLCKSVGAIVLMTVGVFDLAISRRLRSTIPLALLTLVVPAYLVSRIAFHWQPSAIIGHVEEIDSERADSFKVRVVSDQALVERAMERPWFGWGGWGRFRVGVAITDSLWAIVLGSRGLVGLLALFGMMVVAQLLAIAVNIRRLRLAHESFREQPEVVVSILLLALYALDCMLNAMPGQIFTAIAAGLLGYGAERDALRSQHAGVLEDRVA
jgi:hypothetical protein